MGRGIVKLANEKSEWYVEWSTVVDAPVSFGASREEVIEYMRDSAFKSMYMHDPEDKFVKELVEKEVDSRLRRLDSKGTSFIYAESADKFIRFNRAGKNETCLNKEQLIEWYCIRKQDPEVEGIPLEELEN